MGTIRTILIVIRKIVAFWQIPVWKTDLNFMEEKNMDFMNIFTPLHSSFELSILQLKSLLASTITSKLPTFTYNGAYIWYSPWEDHCRRVIQVYPLKGASSVFRWGAVLRLPAYFRWEWKSPIPAHRQVCGIALVLLAPGSLELHLKAERLLPF